MTAKRSTAAKQPMLVSPEIEREYKWAFAHYGQLARQYPNQWVAFANRRVLAGGPHLLRVLAKARQQVDWPHVPHLFVEAGVHFYANCP